jgi:hypothetical protein
MTTGEETLAMMEQVGSPSGAPSELVKIEKASIRIE